MPTRLLLEGTDLEELLAQVRQEYGPNARIVSADRLRTGGLGGFFAKETYEVSVEIDDPSGVDQLTEQAAQQDSVEVSGLRPKLSTEDDRFAEIFATLRDEFSQQALGDPPPTAAPLYPVAQPPPAPASPAAPIEPPPAPAPPPAERPDRPVSAGGPAYADLYDQLRGLGLPRLLARRAVDEAGAAGDRFTGLVRGFATAPEPPPLLTGAGQITVLAGECGPTYRLARRLADSVRIPESAIMVAADQHADQSPDRPCNAHSRVDSSTAAGRAAAVLRTGDLAGLVVLDVPFAARHRPWVERMLRVIHPDALWAVVDATRKPADLAAYLAALGPVDALAVEHAALSAEPGTVLSLDRPIALLDGVPATGHAWAAVLSAKLTVEAG